MTSETKGLGDPAPASAAAVPINPRVAQLKRAIERGEYSLEEKLIAEKIIASGALGDLN